MSALLRAFVAVEIPEEVRAALDAAQARLRQHLVRARWVRSGSMHLTLKFLGDIPAGQVAGAADALQVAVRGHAALRLSAAGIGAFPGIRRPRVLWAGLSGETEPLADLQRSVEEELAALGFPREERPFRAHLTIGRFSEPVAPGPLAEALKDFATASFGEFTVQELVLFRSELKPSGAVYTALARVKLENPC
jgi:RNA 2',3'-cyclic 3'-phosphodiesterase